jgi:hypothetical protein
MTSKVISRTAIRGGFILSVLMATYACNPNKTETKRSNNLEFVQCDPNGVSVPVTKTNGVPATYEYIFVCAGNNVQWFTDDDNFTFDVDFDPGSNPNDLFDPAKPPFHSKPDPSGKHKHATDVQKVSDKAKKYKDYSYTIHATDKTGKAVPTSDPHIIPM